MSIVAAAGLKKRYGEVAALDGFDLSVGAGQIVGLIGPNGSGKTTALKALLGLTRIDEGELQVLGRDPVQQRAELMGHVAYIADTGILPKWMRVCDLLDYVDSVHPRFDIEIAKSHLAKTNIHLKKKVRVLSKGMHVQMHLALVLAIDAQLLVLDEPTLGLDILYRQQFYDGVLNDYFTQQRGILVTTHEVREIEHILTHVVFIHRGKASLALSMQAIADEFTKLVVADAKPLPWPPLFQRKSPAGHEAIFRGVPRDELAPFGQVSTPNLAELFVAVVEGCRG